jgi:hypothetical protein
VKFNLKITKTDNLNERKLIFTDIAEDYIVEFISDLKEIGFV